MSIIHSQEVRDQFQNIYTTLVIIEENENGKIILKDRPVSDGIFEAMWNKDDKIFFDMLIEKPLKMIHNQLDVRPFLKETLRDLTDIFSEKKLSYNYLELDLSK